MWTTHCVAYSYFCVRSWLIINTTITIVDSSHVNSQSVDIYLCVRSTYSLDHFYSTLINFNFYLIIQSFKVKSVCFLLLYCYIHYKHIIEYDLWPITLCRSSHFSFLFVYQIADKTKFSQVIITRIGKEKELHTHSERQRRTLRFFSYYICPRITFEEMNEWNSI